MCAMDSSQETNFSDLQDLPPFPKIINPGSKNAPVKLDEENFLVWKFQMMVILRGHGLERFLDEQNKLRFLLNFFLQTLKR